MLSEVDHHHGLCRALTEGLFGLQALWKGDGTTSEEDIALEDLLTALTDLRDERHRLDALFATPSHLSAASGIVRPKTPHRMPTDEKLASIIETLKTVVCGDRAKLDRTAIRNVQEMCVAMLESNQRSTRSRPHVELAS